MLAAKQPIRCRYCSKEYTKQGVWLAKHEETCQERSHNHKLVSFLPTARNIPHDNILNHFNLSICERESTGSDSTCESGALLDTAFFALPTNARKANRSEFSSFRNTTSMFLKNYKNNFSICELNINAIKEKFEDIKFMLNDYFVDIFVLNKNQIRQPR